MNKISIVFFSFLSLAVSAQTITEKLKAINSTEEAQKFVAENENIGAQIITIAPANEKAEVAEEFASKKVGDIFSQNNNTFKIVNSKKIKAFRVSYVFLDGSKLSIGEIAKKRNDILKQYKSGIEFSVLAEKYTMDNSPKGDLGWFTEGMMVSGFESAIKNHKKNDVFLVDLVNENWYYVVLKTFDDREVEELTILRVSST